MGKKRRRIGFLMVQRSLLGMGLSWGAIATQSPILAQTPDSTDIPPITCPASDALPRISATGMPLIAERGLTVPSLWLVEELLAEEERFRAEQSERGTLLYYKLLENWFVEQDRRWVDLVVNRQLWSLLDYLERYDFINRVGTVAKDFNYNTRVCNDRGVVVGIYRCDTNPSTLPCRIELDASGPGGLRGN